MRLLIALVALAAAATGAAAQPKAPPVTIDDRPSAAPKKSRTGDMPPHAAPVGYEWKRYPGEPWNLFPVAAAATAAPGVAAPSTFRTGGFHADHRCPNCGFQSPAGSGTWVVRGSNPDGTHNHVCPACGSSWRH